MISCLLKPLDFNKYFYIIIIEKYLIHKKYYKYRIYLCINRLLKTLV